MAEIEGLNEDVLLEIFSYLNIHDRQSMGLVCKKWQAVYEIMLDSIHKMCCNVFSDIGHEPFVEIKNNVLFLHTHKRVYTEKPLKKFASNLTKIIIMDFDDSDDLPPSFYELLTKCTKLSFIHLDCHYSQSAEEFLKFLPTDNLEDLSIILNDRYVDLSIDITEYYHIDDEWRLCQLMGTVLAKSKLKSLNLANVNIPEMSWSEEMNTLTKIFIRLKDSEYLNFDVTKLQNLEMLAISCDKMYNDPLLTELMKNCRKLHFIRFDSEEVLSETTLNEMMSLPNLRYLSLSTRDDTYETWHQFSNLEVIRIGQYLEPFSATKDQIKSFLQRSRNLKTYYFSCSELIEMVDQVASDIGHECKMGDFMEMNGWTDVIPF
ncbi:hypothetical protein PV327_005131 [Microctonus hyperodae]|uniref:F-box domain-containing protein n=1 Tax=Microctonus hyperodae TaxID=165561 RepID=A0AA39G111_MICHY|nr:hypothetical protein PV327_005131 [Microctonus hyperodae]